MIIWWTSTLNCEMFDNVKFNKLQNMITTKQSLKNIHSLKEENTVQRVVLEHWKSSFGGWWNYVKNKTTQISIHIIFLKSTKILNYFIDKNLLHARSKRYNMATLQKLTLKLAEIVKFLSTTLIQHNISFSTMSEDIYVVL